MKGFVSSTTQTLVDQNGHERVRTETKQFVYKSEEEPFYAVFFNYIRWVYNLNGSLAIKLLLRLMETAEFNTGKVLVTTGVREDIMSTLGICSQAVSRALKELVDVGALSRVYFVDKRTGEERVRKGEYTVNPQMFWKGDFRTRKKLTVEFKAEYDNDGLEWENAIKAVEDQGIQDSTI